ncbi:MAG: EamA family transporter [Hyphomicrobiales bacterium]|nr:EamA family transporter [Hyphomicrobiales bacterium]MCP5371200.1 EamA family transporter [Hyphomicrobiales bacterium]
MSAPAMAEERAPAMRPLDLLALSSMVLIWACNFIIGKLGVAQIPPILLVALRFTLVAVLLFPFLRRPGPALLPVAAISFVLGALHFSLMFTGLRGVDAAAAAITTQLMVPFSVLLAALFFRERTGPMQIGGIVLAFAGVYTISGDVRAGIDPLYLLMIVGAAFTFALASVQIKKLGPVNVFVLNARIALLAAPQLFLASAVLEHDHLQALQAADWRGWGAVVFGAVFVTVAGHGLYYHLLGKYPVNKVVPPTLLVPVLAVVLAVLILDEPLTARIVVGGLLTVTGVAVVELVPGRRKR